MNTPEFLAAPGSARYRRLQVVFLGAKAALGRFCNSSTLLRALFVSACLMPLAPARSAAQALNFAVDGTLQTGVRRAPGPDGEAIGKRAPTALQLDVGAILDNDYSSEWGAGLIFQMEKQAAVAISPQVRLVRGEDPWNVLLGVGVPIYVTPDTLFGAKLDVGGVFRFTETLGVVAIGSAQYFFAGGDLPKDGSVLIFNLGAGLRVLL